MPYQKSSNCITVTMMERLVVSVIWKMYCVGLIKLNTDLRLEFSQKTSIKCYELLINWKLVQFSSTGKDVLCLPKLCNMSA